MRIVDRKKELIINAAGKNMSPANIEARIKAASPLIGQAVCIGDARPYNVALISLDPDGAAGHDPASPETRALVEQAVELANSQLSRVEQIKKFAIIPGEWQPGGDELTPTMKLKRKPIGAKYARRDRGAVRLNRPSRWASSRWTLRARAGRRIADLVRSTVSP